MYSIKRRTKLAALAAIISVTLLPVAGPVAPANAAPTGTKTFGAFTYEIPFPGYAFITGCVNNTCPANLRIPASIRGNRVYDIASFAFANKDIESVTIANGISVIGEYAFLNCHLEKLILPPSIGAIHQSAFENNYLLSQVSFSKNIFIIDQRAFYDNSLTNVVLPGTLAILGDEAFAGNQLTSVHFKGDAPYAFNGPNPNNVFANNPALTEIGTSPDTQGWNGNTFSGLPVRERIFVTPAFGAPTITAAYADPFGRGFGITARNPSNMPIVTSWRISTDNGATWIKPDLAYPNFGSSELFISGLTIGTRYKIKVVAITDSSGYFARGKEVSRISSTVNFTPTLPN